MNEFVSYLKVMFSRLFKKNTYFNFQVFYSISFIIILYGSIFYETSTIVTGIMMFILTSIYHDYKSGNWKAEQRKEYGKISRKDMKTLKKEQKPIEEQKETKDDGEQQTS